MSSATEPTGPPARDVRSLLLLVGMLVLAVVLARWHTWSIASHYSPAYADARIDVNAATAAELAELPGVGEVLAARIVAERRSAGRFRDVDDLVARVRGLGPASTAELAPRLAFGGD
jgi:competence ComEA-like helix-hairpin-helix protein